MADNTEVASETAIKILDRMMSTADQTINKYGPDVMAATLDLIRYENIFISFSQILGFGILVWIGLYTKRISEKEYEKECEGRDVRYYSVGPTIGICLPAAISFFSALVAFIVSTIFFTNLYLTMLAIYDPKLYLLRKVIYKVIE